MRRLERKKTYEDEAIRTRNLVSIRSRRNYRLQISEENLPTWLPESASIVYQRYDEGKFAIKLKAKVAEPEFTRATKELNLISPAQDKEYPAKERKERIAAAATKAERGHSCPQQLPSVL